MKQKIVQDGKRLIVICFAAVIMALNIKTFVRTGGLYPGGATGLTILIQSIGELVWHITIPYTVVNVILNAIPVYIGYRFIGKKFTMYSVVMIMLTNVLTDFLPSFQITDDILLTCIFGGMINGMAISICLLAGATSGGTDFISIFLSEKKGVDSWNVVLGINAVILVSAGFLFGWDKALYSIIYQFVSTQVLHMLYTKYQKETLFIVTDKPKEICEVIYSETTHGATIIEGEGSFEHCERKVVYSVVSRAESKRLLRVIKKTDENAFVNLMRTDELAGRFYQRPND